MLISSATTIWLCHWLTSQGIAVTVQEVWSVHLIMSAKVYLHSLDPFDHS